MSLLQFPFFSKKKETLHVPDSILVKQVKSLAKNSNLKIFSNIEIFHHTHVHHVDLLIFDNTRGIYLCEIKKWSFNDLKDATIQRAQNTESSKNTLAFDKTRELIKRKFNEITHNDGVEIYNFLLMENMSENEYDQLDETFKVLLPKERIIFNDDDNATIFKKLQDVAPENINIPSTDFVLGTLFTQYALLDEHNHPRLCNPEQKTFIDAPLSQTSYLQGKPKSGKSSLLLLKAIYEVFKNGVKDIVIIKPTVYAREKMYKNLLEIVEHGIIEIDLSRIEILTPLDVCNQHLQKLKKPSVDTLEAVDPKLYKKRFNLAKMVFCDDADFLPKIFLEYLTKIQKNKHLLLATIEQPSRDDVPVFEFHRSYTHVHTTLMQTNPFAKALYLINKLSSEYPQEAIVIVAQQQTLNNIQEDMHQFVPKNVLIIEHNTHLQDRDTATLQAATYDTIYELCCSYIILLDLSQHNKNKIEYTIHLAHKEAFVLYENMSETLQYLKEKYEGSKN